MKNLLIPFFALFVFTANASIEHVPGENTEPTVQELNRNRACFEELAKQGCGEPGENIKQFRTCLHESFPSLTDDCRKMMSNLYSKKN